MGRGMKILVLNGGSSSFKCWFQDVPDGQLPSEGLAPRWSARADWSRNARNRRRQDRSIRWRFA